MKCLKSKIQEYEAFFGQPHEQSFDLVGGQGAVMVSAPHSVAQTRRGKIKCAEPQTGVLARLLHDDMHCPVIYKTGNCTDDANYDKTSPYKDALVSYIESNGIRFLIDLHQLSPKRDVGIDFGTAGFKNIYDLELLNILLGEFSMQDIGRIQIDVPFSASCPNTIATYTHNRCNIQSVQIEINSGLLYGDGADLHFEKVYIALRNSIRQINDYLGK